MVSDILAGDGKNDNLVYSVIVLYTMHLLQGRQGGVTKLQNQPPLKIGKQIRSYMFLLIILELALKSKNFTFLICSFPRSRKEWEETVL